MLKFCSINKCKKKYEHIQSNHLHILRCYLYNKPFVLMFVNYFSKISINLVYQPLSFSVSSGQSLVFDWSLEDLENPAADEVLKNGLFPAEVQRSFILPCLPEGSSFVCTSQWCPEGCS